MKEMHAKLVNFIRPDLKEAPTIYAIKTQPPSDNYVFHKKCYYV